MKDAIEVMEGAELEQENTADQSLLIQDEAISLDAMDSMIKAANKMEAYDKALTTIMSAVMKRTYAGDWVCHSRERDAIHLRSASLSGAGCERVAVILGISEKNWKEFPKQIMDDGKHYSYRYEADFVLGGRSVHAYGEASTKNKFFGYENGAWKELTDIREDHVRKAAQRECQKDGIRRLLGLRKIPLLKLQELGFKLDQVHYVNFKDVREATGGKSFPQTNTVDVKEKYSSKPAVDKPKTELVELSFNPTKVEEGKSATGHMYTKFYDEQNSVYYRSGPPDDPITEKLTKAYLDGSRVKVKYLTQEKNGVVYKNIQDLVEVIAL